MPTESREVARKRSLPISISRGLGLHRAGDQILNVAALHLGRRKRRADDFVSAGKSHLAAGNFADFGSARRSLIS